MTPLDIYITSDLHYGLYSEGDRNTEALAEHVLAHPTAALVLAGDLGAGPETLAACLDLFKDFPGLKLAVPGNHDIWLDGWSHKDSWRLHEVDLPALFEAHGFHPLHLKPLRAGQMAFVGTMGWYDYSFRDEINIPYACYEHKTPPWSTRPIWADARFAAFDEDDVTLTRRLTQRLARQLVEVGDAEQVVAISHHVVDKALLVHPRERVPLRWRFANAFLGSNALGETLAADPRVRLAVCGHIHMARRASVGTLQALTIGSTYTHKELIKTSLRRVLQTKVFGEVKRGG